MANGENQDGDRPWWLWLLIFLIVAGIIYLLVRFFVLGRDNLPLVSQPTETPSPTVGPTETLSPFPSPTPLTSPTRPPTPTFAPSPRLPQTPQTGPPF